MSVLLITHPVFEHHEVPDGHPEHAGRIRSVGGALQPFIDADEVTLEQAPCVTREQLEAVHTVEYIDLVFQRAPEEGLIDLDYETTMGPHTLEAARRAAGAVCHAVDRVFNGDAQRAFCAVRPPGHHARSHNVAGFCIFNNVAVAAAHALTLTGVERVAIVDFDVHHGDGTEEIFRDRPDVLMCSTYQYPLYPQVNLPSIAGSQINVPLPAGAGSDRFREAVSQEWLPELDAFRPSAIFISAGFDAHRLDPLGGLRLDENDFAWATQQMCELATRHCEGRVVAVLEGGYSLDALALSTTAVVGALINS